MDPKTLSTAERAFRDSVARITYAHKVAQHCLRAAHSAPNHARFVTWIRRHARISHYIYTHAKL